MDSGETKEKTAKEECYICGQLCFPRRMLSHIRSHTNVEINECEVCGDRFATKKSLLKHYITHTTHFVCEHCNQKFVDPYRLRTHRCNDEEKVHSCPECGKEFFQKNRLDKHLISHAEKIHVCDICGKSFRHKGNLTAHYRVHYKGEDGKYVKSVLKETFTCDLCQKVFASRRNLQRHSLCHSNDKPYICEICDRGFTHKHNMESHVRLHNNDDKPYQCEQCNKAFNRKYNLKVHYIMHNRRETGEAAHKVIREKTFACEICCKRFTSQRNLDRHQVTHTKEKPYVCEFCGMRFAYDSTLKRHSHFHTDEGYVRSDKKPKLVSITSSMLSEEQKLSLEANGVDINCTELFSRSFNCDVCKQVFLSRVDLKSHIRPCTPECKYRCCICLQGFKLKKRLREHQKIHDDSAEEKPKVCVIKIEDPNSMD